MVSPVVTDTTEPQLRAILRWLKIEWLGALEQRSGFHFNRSIIRRAVRSNECNSLVLGNRCLAFCVFTLRPPYAAIDIFEVRPRFRARGYGKVFASHIVDMLFAGGAREIHVECSPVESESFWRAVAFIDCSEPRGIWGAPKLVRRTCV